MRRICSVLDFYYNMKEKILLYDTFYRKYCYCIDRFFFVFHYGSCSVESYPQQTGADLGAFPCNRAHLRAFKKDIEKPIAVILILNTAAHTFGASIAGAEFDELFGNRYIWIFSLAFTVMMVQYTEILPKTLGVRFNLPVMAYTARTLKFLVWLMSPLIALVHLINRPFDPHKKRKERGEDQYRRDHGAGDHGARSGADHHNAGADHPKHADARKTHDRGAHAASGKGLHDTGIRIKT